MEYSVNYIFCFLSLLLFIAGIIFLIKGFKEGNLTIQKAAAEHIEYIKQLTKEQEQKYNHLLHCRSELEDDIGELKKERELEQERAREAKENADRLLESEQNRVTAEVAHQKELELMKLKLTMDREREGLQALYNTKNIELESNFLQRKEEIESKLMEYTADLEKFQAISESVNKAILRQKELKEKEDFYSIQVTENDKEDIKVLQSMDLKLHNRDVIPKLVWELYIRRPCQEMIKRVTGGRKIGGIYKITNKETGEAYIGKTSSDFGARWTNHIKTTLGLDGCARATLHNRMAQDGLWNYTFEIIEEVDKEHQAEREAFYIDLYGTKQQLNMKEGSK